MHPSFVTAAKGVLAAADIFATTRPGPRLLIYHQVGVDLGRQMEVSEDTFRRQMDWLQENGELVDLETALDRRAEPSAHQLYTIGFDDGYRDLFDVAYPILLKGGIPFTLYLTTSPTETGVALTPGGQADPLTWDQVNEMLASDLMTLGVHTHSHPDLRGMDAGGIADELDRSNALISERCGAVPEHFAYPKGYWDATADSLVRARYRSAALGAGGQVTGDTDPFLLHRIPVQKSDVMAYFTRKMRTGMRLEETVRRVRSGYRGP